MLPAGGECCPPGMRHPAAKVGSICAADGTIVRPRAGFRAEDDTLFRPWAVDGAVPAQRLPVAVAVGSAVLVVGQHQVPAVAAVLAAVGDDVAGQPYAVFGRVGEQVAAATAVDAGDGGFRLQHARSLAGMEAVTTCE